jgi:multidrug transporter EmrE-like cation transporter
MTIVMTLTHEASRRLTEVGLLFVIFAGVWLVAAEIPQLKLGTAKTIVAGIALAIAGVLLIIAAHWGYLGS